MLHAFWLIQRQSDSVDVGRGVVVSRNILLGFEFEAIVVASP
jgi:hypothetical protein